MNRVLGRVRPIENKNVHLLSLIVSEEAFSPGEISFCEKMMLFHLELNGRE